MRSSSHLLLPFSFIYSSLFHIPSFAYKYSKIATRNPTARTIAHTLPFALKSFSSRRTITYLKSHGILIVEYEFRKPNVVYFPLLKLSGCTPWGLEKTKRPRLSITLWFTDQDLMQHDILKMQSNSKYSVFLTNSKLTI